MAAKKKSGERDPLHVLLEPETRERLNEIQSYFEGVSLAKLMNAMITIASMADLYRELQRRGHMPDLEKLLNALDEERKR